MAFAGLGFLTAMADIAAVTFLGTKNDTFTVVPGIKVPDARDRVWLPIHANTQYYPPGARVDVIASVHRGGSIQVFKLLADVSVAEVDRESNERVALSLTSREAGLVKQATAIGCTLSLVLRGRDTGRPPHDLDAVARRLDELTLPVAPPPRPVAPPAE
jgi:hypothetical protein